MKTRDRVIIRLSKRDNGWTHKIVEISQGGEPPRFEHRRVFPDGSYALVQSSLALSPLQTQLDREVDQWEMVQYAVHRELDVCPACGESFETEGGGRFLCDACVAEELDWKEEREMQAELRAGVGISPVERSFGWEGEHDEG